MSDLGDLRLLKLAKEYIEKGLRKDALHCLSILETRLKKKIPTYLHKG